MRFGLVWSDDFIEQVKQAREWWDENREKAPGAIDHDLDEALERIRESPEAIGHVGRLRGRPIRSVHLDRIRYSVFYAVDVHRRTVELVAFWHGRRR